MDRQHLTEFIICICIKESMSSLFSWERIVTVFENYSFIISANSPTCWSMEHTFLNTDLESVQ